MPKKAVVVGPHFLPSDDPETDYRIKRGVDAQKKVLELPVPHRPWGDILQVLLKDPTFHRGYRLFHLSGIGALPPD